MATNRSLFFGSTVYSSEVYHVCPFPELVVDVFEEFFVGGHVFVTVAAPVCVEDHHPRLFGEVDGWKSVGKKAGNEGTKVGVEKVDIEKSLNFTVKYRSFKIASFLVTCMGNR